MPEPGSAALATETTLETLWEEPTEGCVWEAEFERVYGEVGWAGGPRSFGSLAMKVNQISVRHTIRSVRHEETDMPRARNLPKRFTCKTFNRPCASACFAVMLQDITDDAVSRYIGRPLTTTALRFSTVVVVNGPDGSAEHGKGADLAFVIKAGTQPIRQLP
ncbi:hypothetical protein Q7P37_010673 [Cladosporium fusiforme]